MAKQTLILQVSPGISQASVQDLTRLRNDALAAEKQAATHAGHANLATEQAQAYALATSQAAGTATAAAKVATDKASEAADAAEQAAEAKDSAIKAAGEVTKFKDAAEQAASRAEQHYQAVVALSEEFHKIYLGEYTIEPTANDIGFELMPGMLFFHRNDTPALKVFDGMAWLPAAAAATPPPPTPHWSDASAARKAGERYINQTGQCITLNGVIKNTNGNPIIHYQLLVDDVPLVQERCNESGTIKTFTCRIPDNSRYQLNITDGQLAQWFELTTAQFDTDDTENSKCFTGEPIAHRLQDGDLSITPLPNHCYVEMTSDTDIVLTPTTTNKETGNTYDWLLEFNGQTSSLNDLNMIDEHGVATVPAMMAAGLASRKVSLVVTNGANECTTSTYLWPKVESVDSEDTIMTNEENNIIAAMTGKVTLYDFMGNKSISMSKMARIYYQDGVLAYGREDEKAWHLVMPNCDVIDTNATNNTELGAIKARANNSVVGYYLNATRIALVSPSEMPTDKDLYLHIVSDGGVISSGKVNNINTYPSPIAGDQVLYVNNISTSHVDFSYANIDPDTYADDPDFVLGADEAILEQSPLYTLVGKWVSVLISTKATLSL